ncbi:uncharacterized protein LOC111046358, partial [Nilaparvata lugens]|uniref:uncharacterized protein LOC111046358 n=1 Tax=Nilaparvata lugens TaxID=108931 RepID=UPI00193DC985
MESRGQFIVELAKQSCLNEAIIENNDHGSDFDIGNQDKEDIRITELKNSYANLNEARMVDNSNHECDNTGNQDNEDIEIMELNNYYANIEEVEPAFFQDSLHEKDSLLQDNQAIVAEDMTDAEEEYGLFDDDDDDPDYIPNSQEDINFVSQVPRKAGRFQTAHPSENVAATSGDVDSVPESLENSALHNGSAIKKSRKRIRSENTWRRNEIKRKRNRGESYKNWRGVHVEQRTIKEVCNNCRMKCASKFTEDERLAIFTEFWNLGEIDRQRDFIINTIQQTPKKRIRIRNGSENGDSCRKVTFSYSLKCDQKEEVVCQRFYLNTLSISQQMVKTAFLKIQASGKTVSEDRRGKSGCNSKLEEKVKISVKDHIESFPKVESHYCRRDSKREYLDQKLNLSKMYSLYKVHCKENGISNMAKESMYRYIFNTNYNLGFFQPKKDQCDLCEKFKNLDEEGKTLQGVVDEHLLNKVAAREAKEKAKERSKND